MGVLGDIAIADLDDGLDSLNGYRSALHGRTPPSSPLLRTPAQEAEELAMATDEWREEGVAWGDIVVVARTVGSSGASPGAGRARHPHR